MQPEVVMVIGVSAVVGVVALGLAALNYTLKVALTRDKADMKSESGGKQ